MLPYKVADLILPYKDEYKHYKINDFTAKFVQTSVSLQDWRETF